MYRGGGRGGRGGGGGGGGRGGGRGGSAAQDSRPTNGRTQKFSALVEPGDDLVAVFTHWRYIMEEDRTKGDWLTSAYGGWRVSAGQKSSGQQSSGQQPSG
jgi:hypothetical protein